MFQVLLKPFPSSVWIPDGHDIALVWFHGVQPELLMLGVFNSLNTREDLTCLFQEIKSILEGLPDEYSVFSFLKDLGASLEQDTTGVFCERIQ